MGMGIKGISSAFHLSRDTVRKYVRKYQESGLTTEQMLSMSEDKLQDLFLDGKNRSRVPSSRRTELDALVPDYVKRLSKKGVTVKSLHEEYQKEHPDGYQYTQFKLAIRAYKCQIRAVGHVEHLAGDQMYIDYAGDKLEIVDEATGEVRSVEVLGQRIIQLTPFFSEDYERDMMDRIPCCTSGRWHPAFTDITAKGADKGTGILAMTAHLGLNPRYTMAFATEETTAPCSGPPLSALLWTMPLNR